MKWMIYCKHIANPLQIDPVVVVNYIVNKYNLLVQIAKCREELWELIEHNAFGLLSLVLMISSCLTCNVYDIINWNCIFQACFFKLSQISYMHCKYNSFYKMRLDYTYCKLHFCVCHGFHSNKPHLQLHGFLKPLQFEILLGLFLQKLVGRHNELCHRSIIFKN
jgi:hypothetical protein